MEMKENPQAYLLNMSLLDWNFSRGVSQSNRDSPDNLTTARFDETIAIKKKKIPVYFTKLN